MEADEVNKEDKKEKMTEKEKMTDRGKKPELTEKQQENQIQDKKALKKFLLLLLCGVLAGFAAGVGSRVLGDAIKGDGILGNAIKGDGLQNIWQKLVRLFSIYGAYVYTTVLVILSRVFYKKARTLFHTWQEDDEVTMNEIDKRVSYVTWFSQLILYGSYFFLAVGAWAADLTHVKAALETQGNLFWIAFPAVIVHMVYALVAGCIIQQKAVNLEKEINPEKQGSVYDRKFQDKWLDSCDEAERYTIYRCSFKTFKVMQNVGIFLWLICLIGQISFGTGVFATVMVTVYLIVQTSVYCLYGIHIESKEK